MALAQLIAAHCKYQSPRSDTVWKTPRRHIGYSAVNSLLSLYDHYASPGVTVIDHVLRFRVMCAIMRPVSHYHSPVQNLPPSIPRCNPGVQIRPHRHSGGWYVERAAGTRGHMRHYDHSGTARPREHIHNGGMRTPDVIYGCRACSFDFVRHKAHFREIPQDHCSQRWRKTRHI